MQVVKVKNDKSKGAAELLLRLKAVIAKQLPIMQREHIIRLLFDHRHESMVLLVKGEIIGGSCFRLFEGFAELAFLAIRADYQVSGYGSTLISHLKSELQERSVRYLFTYADNLAIGFFKKQGFTLNITLPTKYWKGFVKKYDGGTLMEARVHDKIDYRNIKTTVKEQKQQLIQKVMDMSVNEIEFDSEDWASDVGMFTLKKEDGQEMFRVNPQRIRGVIEAGWSWDEHLQLNKTVRMPFYHRCMKILNLVRDHPHAWPFLQPVSVEEVPEYTKYISHPMDLKTMQKKLDAQCYPCQESFAKDLSLIFSNCRTFNYPDSIYYRCADEVQRSILDDLRSFIKGVLDL